MSEGSRDWLALIGVDRWSLAPGWRGRCAAPDVDATSSAPAPADPMPVFRLVTPRAPEEQRLWARIRERLAIPTEAVAEEADGLPGQIWFDEAALSFSLAQMCRDPATKRIFWLRLADWRRRQHREAAQGG